MKNNLFDYGRVREDHIVSLFRKQGYTAVINECFDEEGNSIAQTYVLNGYHRSYPDIDIFELEKDKECVLRVEVKSFSALQNSSVRKNGKVLPISVTQFESYLELFRLSEVPTKIIFVIGTPEYYEYYWEDILVMNSLPKKKGKHFDGEKDCYFWRPEDLKRGLDGFLDVK